MNPACVPTPAVTTYQCCKLFLSQLVSLADRSNWLVENVPGSPEEGYSFREKSTLVLPETVLKFRLRRRHSIAIDQLLAQLKADQSDPNALRLHFLTLQADIPQKDKKNVHWDNDLERERFLTAEKKKAIVRKIQQDGFAMLLNSAEGGTPGRWIYWLPFLRSASMSRRSILSFVSLHEETPEKELLARNRLLAACSLGLSGQDTGCPKAGWAGEAKLLLSKWNAYQGLALSDADSMASAFPCGTTKTNDPAGPIYLNENSVVIVSDSIVFDKVYRSFINGNDRADFAFSAQWPHNVFYQPTVQLDGALDPELTKIPAPERREITPFDGMGLISPAAAGRLREALRAPGASSFQIRLPMIKGMLVEVDFLQYLQRIEANFSDKDCSLHRAEEPHAFFLRDIYGIDRKIDENVHFILTKSQFKAWRWFQCAAGSSPDAPKDPVKEYFARAAKYGHSLYVCRAIKPPRERPHDWLNYQVLSTAGFSAKENFALAEPTVRALAGTAVEDACGDAARFALLHWKDPVPPNAEGQAAVHELSQTDGGSCFHVALECCPELLFTGYGRAQVAKARARRALAAQRGRLRVEGTTRFLIADPGAFLHALAVNCAITAASKPSASGSPAPLPEDTVLNSIYAVWKETLLPLELADYTVYVPGLDTRSCQTMQCGDVACPVVSLFRNPHLSQAEQTLVLAQTPDNGLYLKHLTGTVLLPARSLLPMRLGGADFDGDIARVISDKTFVGPLSDALQASETAAATEFGSNFAALGAVPPQLPLVNMDPPKDDPKEADISFTPSDFRLADAELFLRTGQNKVGRYSNAAVSLSAAKTAYVPGSDRTGEDRVRLMTYAVGMEIDSAKTGRVVRLPKGFCGTKDMPFLEFNRQVKSGDLRANIFSFYPRDLKSLLDRQTTAAQAALFLQSILNKPGWLNILPYYLRRRQKELELEFFVLHSLQDRHCVPPLLQNRSSQEILQLAHGVSYCGDASPEAVKAQKFLASAEAYNKEQTCTLDFPLKPDPAIILQPKLLAALALLAGGYKTAVAKQESAALQKDLTGRMVQLLFYYAPGKPPEDYAKQASDLQAVLRTCVSQSDAPVENAVKALQSFARRVLTPDSLFAADRSKMLTRMLNQLCTECGTVPTDWETFLDLCTAAVTDGGYLLPALAAQAVAQTLLDEQALQSHAERIHAQKHATSALLQDAQTPTAGLSTHDAAACFAGLQDLYQEGDDGSFRREPIDSDHGQKHLRRLALQLTRLFRPGENTTALRRILLAHCLALADPALDWDRYFSDPALQCLTEDDRRYLRRVVKTEAGDQKFLWDCAGDPLLQALQAEDHSRPILSANGVPVTAGQWLCDPVYHTNAHWQEDLWRALRQSLLSPSPDTTAEGGAMTHDP